MFASGAEFTDSEQSGAARINEMFSIARRNVNILPFCWFCVFFFFRFKHSLCAHTDFRGKLRSFGHRP